MKSVKQISEEIGVSKVSIYRFLKKPELKKYLKMDDKTTLVNNVGELIIKEYYARQQASALGEILDAGAGTPELSDPAGMEDSGGLLSADDNKAYHVDTGVNKNALPGEGGAPEMSGGADGFKPIDYIRFLESQSKFKDDQLRQKDEQLRQKDNQLNALLVLLNKESELKLIDGSAVEKVEKADKPAEDMGSADTAAAADMEGTPPAESPAAGPDQAEDAAPPRKKGFFGRLFRKKKRYSKST